MTRFKKFLTAALVALLVLPMAPLPPAQAQVGLTDALTRVVAGDQVGGGFGALSTDVGIIVRFVGQGTTTGGGTVTVDAATGDITFKTGPVAGSAADTTLECPESGAFAGVFDVSDAACDTFGEVVDKINRSASNWRAVIVDGLRSDSSNNTLITLAETAANQPEGLGLLKDTTVALNISYKMDPDRATIDPKIRRNDRSLVNNPYNDSRGVLFRAQANFTGTGASTFEVWSVNPNNAVVPGAGSSTETLIWSETGAATTVDFTFDASEIGLYGKKGNVLLVRYKAATTFTAGRLFTSGLSYKFK